MKEQFLKAYFFAKKKSETINTVISSSCAFLLTFLVFRFIFTNNDLYPFGKISIAWCDLKQQGIPLLMNLKDVLCGDGSLFYSFNNASGMNFWGVFLFFISNPFSFLVAFFEKSEIYKLVSAFIIFKLCLSAFTATFSLCKMCKKTYKGINTALGISYGLCAYGLMYSQNIMWLDIMYLYPLLIYGIHRITEQKGCGLYTVILVLCVLFNFYLSFMVVLSILIIVGLYFIISKDDKAKKKDVGFNFLKGSFIAALVSAISWLPAFLQYSSSGRGESLFDTLAKSKWETTKTTIYLVVLSSTVIIMVLFSFFKPTRRKTSLFIALVLFAIPIVNEPINKMWHTGSYMAFPGRYAFITIFIGLYLVALTLEPGELTEIRKKKIKKLRHEKENNDSDIAEESALALQEENNDSDIAEESALALQEENNDFDIAEESALALQEENNVSDIAEESALALQEENNDSDIDEESELSVKEEFSFKSLLKTISEKFTENNIRTVVLAISLCLVLFQYLSSSFSYGIFNENRKELSQYTKTLWGNDAQLEIVYRVANIFSVFYVAYVFLFKFKVLQKRIFSIILICIVVCEGIFSVNTYAVTVKDKKVFNGYETFLDLEGRIDDEDFYRIKTEKKYWDSNLIGGLGYNSIGHYTSLTNLEYMNTSKALGYSSSWMELSTYGGTELSDAILGIRYNVRKAKLNNSVYTNGTYSIEKTFASLGLGVKYSGENDVFSYEESSRTDFQEKIFASLFDTNEKLFEKYSPTKADGCSITEENNKTILKGKGNIHYNIKVEGEQSLYFDAFGEFSNSLRQQINKGFDIYVNDMKIATYPDGMYTGFVNLGVFKDEDVKIKIVVKKSKMELLSYGISGLKRNVLKNAVENVESGFMNAHGNKAYGTVSANKGEYLFVSIPYDEGFTVKINGEKVETEKVYGDFYSIPLKSGVNNIKMVFIPTGFIAGLVMSVSGLSICVLLMIFRKKTKSKIRLFIESKLGLISKPIFILLFVLVICIVYVMPIYINIQYK